MHIAVQLKWGLHGKMHEHSIKLVMVRGYLGQFHVRGCVHGGKALCRGRICQQCSCVSVTSYVACILLQLVGQLHSDINWHYRILALATLSLTAPMHSCSLACIMHMPRLG